MIFKVHMWKKKKKLTITPTWDIELCKCDWAPGTSGHSAMTLPHLFLKPGFPFHQVLGFHYSRKHIVERWWVKIMTCNWTVYLSLSIAFPLLFQGSFIIKIKIHILEFPWNFRYYFWLYNFLILRCFLLLKKDRKQHSVLDLELLNANDKNFSFHVFNRTTCCLFPL